MARVLVIDDQKTVRGVVRRMLEHVGHEVVEGDSAAAGIATWREWGADIVLCDIHMPDKDGIETIREFRALAPELPIIVFSGSDRIEEVDVFRDAVALGALAALVKPFTRDELLATVAGVLARPLGSGTPGALAEILRRSHDLQRRAQELAREIGALQKLVQELQDGRPQPLKPNSGAGS